MYIYTHTHNYNEGILPSSVDSTFLIFEGGLSILIFTISSMTR